jgi:hypothetical protein
MNILNNSVRFFAQALVIESGKAVGHAAVVSAKAVKGVTVTTTEVVAKVSKAPAVKIVEVRSDRKVAKAQKNLAKAGFKIPQA